MSREAYLYGKRGLFMEKEAHLLAKEAYLRNDAASNEAYVYGKRMAKKTYQKRLIHMA